MRRIYISNYYILKKLKPKLTILLLIFTILSCSKQEQEFTLGGDFINSNSNIVMVDTFSLSLSTVILDSLTTSNKGVALCGISKDELLGTVQCNSFIRFDQPTDYSIVEDDVFDSITLVLPFSGYYYGDTLNEQCISVYQLVDEIELPDDDQFYNSSNLLYSDDPFGTIRFIPRPAAQDSIEIRIDDEFGLTLFNAMIDDSELITNEIVFHQFMKGFTVVPGDENTAVLGFLADADDICLRIYSHRIEGEKIEIENEIAAIDMQYQFNQIVSDYNLKGLPDNISQRTAIPSDSTLQRTFMQSGTGIMTKVLFPGLNEFLLKERTAILKAELILKPQKTSFDDFQLPTELMLYETDKYNNIGDIVYNEDYESSFSQFYYDELYHENSSYTFNITSFLQNELSDSYFDVNNGLLIAMPTPEYFNSLDRVIFNATPGSAELRIYELHY